MSSTQVSENAELNNPVPREVSCTVCQHPQRDIIDGILASGSMGRRTVANRFGLTDSAVQRHRSNHLTVRMVKAVERRKDKADDVFMERHERLYAETLQYVEDAKSAVKMQRVTVDTPDGTEERYQAFRDVGAMAPALQTAVALQRVLGDATGRFASGLTPGSINLNLQVVIPRAVDASQAQELPAAIDVVALPEPSE